LRALALLPRQLSWRFVHIGGAAEAAEELKNLAHSLGLTERIEWKGAQAQGEELRTVIAGYHWFTDWGRDTMISLEGLTLVTGRWAEAGYILRTFARYIRDGDMFTSNAAGSVL
jgi:glycogen debranching enzyme